MTRAQRVAVFLAFQLAGLGLYFNYFNNPLVWDDHTFVAGQPLLRDPANLKRIWVSDPGVSSLTVRGAARPAWLASLLLDRLIFGERFWAWRMVSAMWHAFGAALLLVLAYRLTGRAVMAVCAALLFLFHPVHTEAVALLTYRSDLMAFAFTTMALCLYVEGWNQGWRWRAGMFAALVAGLLSKESSVVAPLLALLCDGFFPAPSAPRRRAAVFAVMNVIVFSYLAFRAPRSGYRTNAGSDVFSEWQGPRASAHKPLIQTPPYMRPYYEDPATRLRTSLVIFADRVRLLVWPARLQIDHSQRPSDSWWDPAVLRGAALLAAMLAGCVLLRAREPAAALGLAWVLVGLLPVSGIFLLLNPHAERYLYLPSAGACLVVAAAIARLAQEPRLRILAFAALATLLTAGAWRVVLRGADYRSDVALHESTVRCDPGVARAHAALGQAYAYSGRRELARREYQRALELWPGYRWAEHGLRELAGP